MGDEEEEEEEGEEEAAEKEEEEKKEEEEEKPAQRKKKSGDRVFLPLNDIVRVVEVETTSKRRKVRGRISTPHLSTSLITRTTGNQYYYAPETPVQGDETSEDDDAE